MLGCATAHSGTAYDTDRLLGRTGQIDYHRPLA